MVCDSRREVLASSHLGRGLERTRTILEKANSCSSQITHQELPTHQTASPNSLRSTRNARLRAQGIVLHSSSVGLGTPSPKCRSACVWRPVVGLTCGIAVTAGTTRALGRTVLARTVARRRLLAPCPEFGSASLLAPILGFAGRIAMTAGTLEAVRRASERPAGLARALLPLAGHRIEVGKKFWFLGDGREPCGCKRDSSQDPEHCRRYP
jgi:hypothetical protein